MTQVQVLNSGLLLTNTPKRGTLEKKGTEQVEPPPVFNNAMAYLRQPSGSDSFGGVRRRFPERDPPQVETYPTYSSSLFW